MADVRVCGGVSQLECAALVLHYVQLLRQQQLTHLTGFSNSLHSSRTRFVAVLRRVSESLPSMSRLRYSFCASHTAAAAHQAKRASIESCTAKPRCGERASERARGSKQQQHLLSYTHPVVLEQVLVSLAQHQVGQHHLLNDLLQLRRVLHNAPHTHTHTDTTHVHTHMW